MSAVTDPTTDGLTAATVTSTRMTVLRLPPDAPGNYVDDENTPEVAEPNEPA